MFQDMNDMFQESMAPFKKLMEIQQEMLQRVTKQQIECTQQCMQATMNQAAALQQLESPQQFIESQVDYTKRLEQTLKQAGEQNMKAVQDAQAAIQELTSKSFGK